MIGYKFGFKYLETNKLIRRYDSIIKAGLDTLIYYYNEDYIYFAKKTDNSVYAKSRMISDYRTDIYGQLIYYLIPKQDGGAISFKINSFDSCGRALELEDGLKNGQHVLFEYESDKVKKITIDNLYHAHEFLFEYRNGLLYKVTDLKEKEIANKYTYFYYTYLDANGKEIGSAPPYILKVVNPKPMGKLKKKMWYKKRKHLVFVD